MTDVLEVQLIDVTKLGRKFKALEILPAIAGSNGRIIARPL
jgi:hypothetical protein